MNKLIAVETSDIVGSTKMSIGQLSQTIESLKDVFNGDILSEEVIIEFYRGDAFQVMYPSANDSFRNLLLVKLFLLSQLDFTVKITQSLALGYVTTPVARLHDRMDQVFINSGRQLTQVDKGAIGITAVNFTSGDHLTLSFLNRIIDGLSAKQALVIFWYIKNNYPEHKVIAAQLNMTRQNVNTHLLRGNADLIKAFICYFEGLVLGEKV